MRKAIDGLSALIVDALDKEPTSGDIFIFRNKSGDKIKLLYWDKNGFMLCYKRLAKGRFKFPRDRQGCITISAEQLSWLLMGFDFTLSQTTKSVKNSLYYY